MVLDTSAIVAILAVEPEAKAFASAIERDPIRLLSAANLLETALVAENRWGAAAGRELDLILHRSSIEVVPVDADQIEVARRAHRQYGRRRHRAGLNFGDCFAYALARVSSEPLLFKGDDFSRTDLPTVELTR